MYTFLKKVRVDSPLNPVQNENLKQISDRTMRKQRSEPTKRNYTIGNTKTDCIFHKSIGWGVLHIKLHSEKLSKLKYKKGNFKIGGNFHCCIGWGITY